LSIIYHFFSIFIFWLIELINFFFFEIIFRLETLLRIFGGRWYSKYKVEGSFFKGNLKIKDKSTWIELN
jgi:hypothetical protein